MTAMSNCCGTCGAVVSADSKFCVECGTAVVRSQPCPACKEPIPYGSKFCVHCGSQIVVAAGAARTSPVWERPPDHFAVRIECGSLESQFAEPGSRVSVGGRCDAFLFQHGHYIGSLEEGSYRLDEAIGRLPGFHPRTNCTVLLASSREVDFDFALEGLELCDEDNLELEIRVQVALSEPTEALTNLLRGRDEITYPQLAERIEAELRASLDSLLRAIDADSFREQCETRDSLRDQAGDRLRRRLEGTGLVVTCVELIRWSGVDADPLRADRARLREDQRRLAITQGQLDVAGVQNVHQRRELELYNENYLDQVQSTAERDRKKSEIETREAAAAAGFRKQTAHQAGMAHLDRQKEAIETRQQYQHELRQNEAARKSEVAETQHAQKVQHWDHRNEQLAHEIDYKRNLQGGRQELDANDRRYRNEAKGEDQQAAIERARAAEQFRQETLLGRRSAELDHDRARSDFEYDQDAREAALAMQLHQQWQASVQQNEDATTERELLRKRTEQEIATDAANSAHLREVQRLKQMSEMSAEALIAASPSEQAKLLAGLRETEALKGFTEEQILARAAAHSPEVAKAFAEKYRSAADAQSASKVQDMYEKFLAAQDRNNDKAMERFASVLTTALTAGAARPPGPAAAVPATPASAATAPAVTPAAVQVQSGSVLGAVADASSAVTHSQNLSATVSSKSFLAETRCPKCSKSVPMGIKFCGGCGFRFIA